MLTSEKIEQAIKYYENYEIDGWLPFPEWREHDG